MAIFNEFPYTNFHELNLDWIIGEVRRIAQEWDETKKPLEDLMQYVRDFLDNLDVSEEISDKLDEMAQDGTLADIINDQIFGEINADLKVIKHNTPSNGYWPSTVDMTAGYRRYKYITLQALMTYLVRQKGANYITGNSFDTGGPFKYVYDGNKQWSRIFTYQQDPKLNDTQVIDGVTYKKIYLNCVGFAALILRGLTFNQSPIKYGLDNVLHDPLTAEEKNELLKVSVARYDPTSLPKQAFTGVDFHNNISIFRESLSQQLANGYFELLAEQTGAGGPVDYNLKGFENLRTGDIIYLARQGSAINSNYYLGIDHCQIYVHPDDIPLLQAYAASNNVTIAPVVENGDNASLGYIVDVSTDVSQPLRFKALDNSIQKVCRSNESWGRVYASHVYPNAMNSSMGAEFADNIQRLGNFTRYKDPAVVENYTFEMDKHRGMLTGYSFGSEGVSANNFTTATNAEYDYLDLDTMTKAGVYYYSSTEWHDITSKPGTDLATILTVTGFNHNRWIDFNNRIPNLTGYQEAVQISASGVNKYIRCCNANGTWSAWKQLTT